MTTYKGASGRQRRIPAEQARKIALTTAIDMLSDSGLTVGLDHLSIEDLINQSNVPRSSFYRLWPAKEFFFADLLDYLVSEDGENHSMFFPETLEAAAKVFEQHKDRLGTHQGRQDVFREAVRVVAEVNFELVKASTTWRTHVALMMTIESFPDEQRREELHAKLRGAELRFVEQMAAFYQRVVTENGFSFKPGTTPEMLAGMCGAYVEGMVQRQAINPELGDQLVTRPGLDGEPVPWHLAALGFWAIASELIDFGAN
ncbi:hypothetical protein [Rarobacter incanus]|uniref:HTH tetR-type domain-containing protein n=1 Tax=Rarobacter incanus TaxID=153494 RepID=A0A542SM81_9MICO|nr:hypothetical protein [Rarobacter incanus]TQK75732.1 hypothetical protein FB389_0366 [Rarobacter incanus]